MASSSPSELEGKARRLNTQGRIRWMLSAIGFSAFSLTVLAIWGPEMEFPFKLGNEIGKGIDLSIRWATINGAFFLDPLSEGVLRFLMVIKDTFLWLPWPIVILVVMIVALKVAGRGIAIFSLLSLMSMGLLGLWASAMETMALIVVAVALSVGIAVPVGIFAARSNKADSVLRPILDAMQTMPSFVYLVPAVMFFGIGDVPAIFATVIYAVPPAIRLTNLGIRQVSSEIVEAAMSFGTTPRQLLLKVQIPMAVPTIMAGINQTIMMALAMVVIASLVGAGGLGEDVNRALNRFEPGKALLSGLGIVFLAIIIDRVTQAAAKERQKTLLGE
jgi:glycine betaine/proline transport system permease protein